MDNHHGMSGMTMSPPPQIPSMTMPRQQKTTKTATTMHMTFYWGSAAQILFPGWPGSSSPGMYIAALLLVFLLTFLLECNSRSTLIDTHVRNEVVSRVLRTLLHATRMAVAYLVMLAVMSFNVGVFMAAIVGHAVGFLVSGSGRSGLEAGYSKHSDVGPVSC